MRAEANSDLVRFLREGREAIDRELAGHLPPEGSGPDALREAMRYTLTLPGKRLRPLVTVACCELLRGRTDAARTLGCAVEMVHAASLILDDLPSQDNATLRRGRPCLHRVHGEATATLAAVALLDHAFGVIAGVQAIRPQARLEAVRVLSTAVGAGGLVGGQIADLAGTGDRLGLDDLEFIHSHKTGALFLAAADLGAVAAGARAGDRDALQRYAKNLGLAFQITDDLLDATGDPAVTGKDAGLDRDHTTFVDLCGVDGARRLAGDLIDTSIACLRTFGRRGALLRELAEYVRGRDR